MAARRLLNQHRYALAAVGFEKPIVGTLNLVAAGVIDAGAGRLSVAGHEVRTSKAVTEHATDGAVTLAVRPEGVHLGDGGPGDNRLHGQVEDINFLGSIVRIRIRLDDDSHGEPPTTMALDTFNEPHMRLPDIGANVTISFPAEACFVLGAAREGALASADAGAQV